jgi:hypothetical protein
LIETIEGRESRLHRKVGNVDEDHIVGRRSIGTWTGVNYSKA